MDGAGAAVDNRATAERGPAVPQTRIAFIDMPRMLREICDEVGAYLLGLWGMPPPLIEAVALHHNPAELPAEVGLAGVVYVANVLAEGGPGAAIDADYLARTGLTDELPRWRRLAAAHLESS